MTAEKDTAGATAGTTGGKDSAGATVARDCAGRVVLVGGGPGDPGLMTVAGLDAVRTADVVVTDRLGPVSILDELDPGIEVIDVGKVPFGPATPQEEINRILVEHARRGRTVVRLKGGDSFLFGRGAEEHLACTAAGVPVTVIPGVTSALSVPALAGVPATHRGLSQGVSVISGHVPPDSPHSTLDYGALARSGTTLVLLMAVTNLAAITAELLAEGLAADTPAIMIENGSTPAERVLHGTLTTIARQAAEAEVAPPAITVIGAVAGLAGQLSAGASCG
ncbi:uroporphyrinogen-III C-methyltransferase [Dietzia kunjamensis]|uniref:uroporphyrinogen-III C-methyltransferase n=1 Tax=Dietzia kunjamensis TaxID=322509 RepID=UPI002DB71177|nr:uroporphyrinogen-III C-methyltransferase [Dietzia kunjamensis]MEB8327548.1 uroporphyrinogen-III C-methyltransferase [Dietzia kunjamensis]